MFSKKATKIDEIFTVVNVVNVKSLVKISSIFVAFLENMNFITLSRSVNIRDLEVFEMTSNNSNFLIIHLIGRETDLLCFFFQASFEFIQ